MHQRFPVYIVKMMFELKGSQQPNRDCKDCKTVTTVKTAKESVDQSGETRHQMMSKFSETCCIRKPRCRAFQCHKFHLK
jgi:hypothetical protein